MGLHCHLPWIIEILQVKAYLSTEATSDEPLDASYISIHSMNNQIKELQVHTCLINPVGDHILIL